MPENPEKPEEEKVMSDKPAGAVSEDNTGTASFGDGADSGAGKNPPEETLDRKKGKRFTWKR
ncbi:hypothetical protein, partial [Streptomyces dysideae]|uniref:hypothetical protein n=1 Tax=Streptomyces dysideae TaxID=909626 RepID=UPI00131E774F